MNAEPNRQGKTFEFEAYGTTYTGALRVGTYASNKNLAVQLVFEDTELGGWDLFTVLTTNIVDLPRIAESEGWACVDTNNFPGGPALIEKLGIGRPDNGKTVRSGFCTYPLYIFDLEKLKEFDPKGVKEYDDFCFGRQGRNAPEKPEL